MSMPKGPPTDDHESHDDCERSDVKVRSVIGLFMSVLIGVGIAQLGLWELLRYFRSSADKHDPQGAPLVDTASLPPAPRLQEHPLRDYRALVAAQERQLTTYGWTDPGKKNVHIPINRAIDLIVERGLPAARKSSETPAKTEPEGTKAK